MAFEQWEPAMQEGEAVSLDGAAFAVGGYLEPSDAVVAVGSELVDPFSFRSAMAHLATGVVMVTTVVKGRPWGLTISACCSVSLDPPLVLVAVNQQTQTWRAVKEVRQFGINIMSANQKDLALVGAAPGRPKFVDDFCDGNPERRTPAIRDALYHLDCDVDRTYLAGTHALIIGRVRSAECLDDREGAAPLVYFDRSFHVLGDTL